MENKTLETSGRFSDIMERADGTGMRETADPACQFYIRVSCRPDLFLSVSYIFL